MQVMMLDETVHPTRWGLRHIMRHSPLIGLVLSTLALGSLVAQEGPRVQPGARVRITAAGLPLRQVGTLAHIDADTLVVGATRVAVQSVRKLEVSTGRRSHTLSGAGIGLLVGAGAGAIAGAIAGTPAGEQTSQSDFSPAELAVVGAVFLGAVGTTVGAIIGASTRTDRWQEVPLHRFGLRMFPRSDGSLSLALLLRF